MDARLGATGIVLLGTNSAGGWPRISPCEAFAVDGDLMLGMMWQSWKARDLLRDPRVTIATPQAEREPTDGDLKLYCTVFDVPESDRRQKYADALGAAIKWRPTEPYHLFAVDVLRGGFISFGDQHRLLRWSAATGIEVLRHPDD
ncbi:MAG: pyridoxamine 5'-phosphate oxidase family protein [Candidatus Dormibacteraceae bacterium]